MIERTGSGPGDAPDRLNDVSRISQRLVDVAVGDGGVVYIDGPRGSGKTELLFGAAEAARGAGKRVLHARGRVLEREFLFGVAIHIRREAQVRERDSNVLCLLQTQLCATGCGLFVASTERLQKALWNRDGKAQTSRGRMQVLRNFRLADNPGITLGCGVKSDSG